MTKAACFVERLDMDRIIRIAVKLKQCLVNTLHVAGNDWVEVERLAADDNRLQACCEAYRDFLGSPLKGIFSKWATVVDTKWLDQ